MVKDAKEIIKTELYKFIREYAGNVPIKKETRFKDLGIIEYVPSIVTSVGVNCHLNINYDQNYVKELEKLKSVEQLTDFLCRYVAIKTIEFPEPSKPAKAA